jgi:hypothetical protein
VNLASTQQNNFSFYWDWNQYFIKGLPRVYRIEANIKGGGSNSGPVAKPFESVGFALSGDFSAEVPWSDFPFLIWHRYVNYARATLPLTVDVIPSINIPTSGETVKTVMGTLTYELSFDPLLNIQPLYSYNYNFSTRASTSDLQIKIGAAVGALPNLGIPQDSNHNFVFIAYGWTWADAGVKQTPVSIGFSTYF